MLEVHSLPRLVPALISIFGSLEKMRFYELHQGGSTIHALCAGCHLQLHAHYFSLTACDRRVT
jgi:hypothetical protein